MILEALGIGAALWSGINSLLSANASAKANALSEAQNRLSLKQQKLGIEDQIRQTDLSITETGSAIGSYESFLDQFAGTSAGQSGAFAGIDIKDSTPDAMKTKETRSAFEQIYNNYAVNDVVAGATGRIGGAQSSMGQTAQSALDSLVGTVSQGAQELDIYRKSLKNLKASKTGLESTLAEIDAILNPPEPKTPDLVPHDPNTGGVGRDSAGGGGGGGAGGGSQGGSGTTKEQSAPSGSTEPVSASGSQAKEFTDMISVASSASTDSSLSHLGSSQIKETLNPGATAHNATQVSEQLASSSSGRGDLISGGIDSRSSADVAATNASNNAEIANSYTGTQASYTNSAQVLEQRASVAAALAAHLAVPFSAVAAALPSSPSSGGPAAAAASRGNTVVQGVTLEGGGSVEIGNGVEAINGNDGGVR